MRILLFLFFIFSLTACGGSKHFSKKYLGRYQGIQSAYTVNVENNVIEIPEEKLALVFEEQKLWITSSRQTMNAIYTMEAETNMYYTLSVKLENGIVEQWQLWKKGKQLIRKQVAPRPEVIFVKSSK